MAKRILSAALALLMLTVPALAEVFTGTSVAHGTTTLVADSAGILEEICMQTGCRVEAGAVLAQLRTTKVFATQDGTVSRIQAEAGSVADGAVLELQPVSRYTLYCTTDGAYDACDMNLIHCGETLYLRCTWDGTHRGVGRVTSIDRETYMVEATAGEFYVGETVYLYRDAEYSKKQRVGIGTLVTAETEVYESTERIVAMHVTEGEYVERGELLYETIDGEAVEICAPVGGIVSSCALEAGASVADGAPLAEIVPDDAIWVAVQVEESRMAAIAAGDTVELNILANGEERWTPGKVVEISGIAGEEGCTVYIAPEEPIAQLGLTVEVRTFD